MKAGDFVCLAYGSGNRDERQFPDPDRYDIARKPRGHLGFGGGVHACLGASVARMATKIAFEEFHKVVPELRRASPTSWPGCRPRPSAARWRWSLRSINNIGAGALTESSMAKITYVEFDGTRDDRSTCRTAGA